VWSLLRAQPRAASQKDQQPPELASWLAAQQPVVSQVRQMDRRQAVVWPALALQVPELRPELLQVQRDQPEPSEQVSRGR
jgi:hypothetical protein